METYTVFGHKSFKKLVCMKPGSRQPTVRAGEPTDQFEYSYQMHFSHHIVLCLLKSIGILKKRPPDRFD